MNVTLLAMLAADRQNANGAIVLFAEMALIFMIFYWLLIRPQRKEQAKLQDMISNVKKGDDVVMSGGLVGTVVHVTDDRLTLKSDQSKFLVERARIARVVGKAGDPAS